MIKYLCLCFQVLDACVNNSGKEFRLEVASREFETEFRKLLGRTQPKVQEKLRALLKTWAEGEFKGDSQLNLIPSLYNALKREGVDFSSVSDQPKKSSAAAALPKDPNVVSSQQEEDDIAKAIQLSLQENKGHTTKSSPSNAASSSSASASLYPSNLAAAASSMPSASSSSGSPNKRDEKKARALYDFEAAEDNELTFKAGEIGMWFTFSNFEKTREITEFVYSYVPFNLAIFFHNFLITCSSPFFPVIIIDDSDANWWKGTNHRGEGLFPANFVSSDLNEEPEQFKDQRRRSVQFNEEVEVVKVETQPEEDLLGAADISEEKIDKVLKLLHEADPTSPESDAPELPGYEEHVNQMGPMIDAELESVDRRHAQLTRLSTELVDALNLYHQLMHENVPPPTYGMATQPPMGGYNPYMGGIPPPTAGMAQQPPQPQFMNGGFYPPNGGAPPMMGYAPPPHPDSQLYAGSAPPPPTPPLSDPNLQQTQPQHFTSPPQSR